MKLEMSFISLSIILITLRHNPPEKLWITMPETQRELLDYRKTREVLFTRHLSTPQR